MSVNYKYNINMSYSIINTYTINYSSLYCWTCKQTIENGLLFLPQTFHGSKCFMGGSNNVEYKKCKDTNCYTRIQLFIDFQTYGNSPSLYDIKFVKVTDIIYKYIYIYISLFTTLPLHLLHSYAINKSLDFKLFSVVQ